ncbi:hypothetical protein G6F46_015678 [Rhizopus delemar]|nr:hypothetical protein G6F46_015678 [Rhizopus delemar]
MPGAAHRVLTDRSRPSPRLREAIRSAHPPPCSTPHRPAATRTGTGAGRRSSTAPRPLPDRWPAGARG